MSRAKKIKYIVLHTTAGWTSAFKVQDYFLRPKSQGGRGWKTGGYHRIVEWGGQIAEMYDFERITNGVLGYNEECIHIAYVGGVNKELYKQGKYVAEDTRNEKQKAALIKCILEAIEWIKENTEDGEECEVMILGHRDFSPDKDGSGVIESWERIKECPCFDAIPEYNIEYGGGSLQPLPYNK